MQLHDVTYIMTLRRYYNHEYMKIYELNEFDCIQVIRNKIMTCDFLLDKSFLEYLQNENISIMKIKDIGFDQLIDNLYKQIKVGEMNTEFILTNRYGVNRLLKFCGSHAKTRKRKRNRYVIHYLTHRLKKRSDF